MSLQDLSSKAALASKISESQGNREQAAVFSLFAQLAASLESELRDVKQSLRTIEDRVRNLS